MESISQNEVVDFANVGNRKIRNLLGSKFGKLMVIEFVGTHGRANNPKHISAYWKCQCDCGNIVVLSREALTGNNTKSCGCLWYERMQLPEGVGALNSIYGRYKDQAHRRGYSFELTFDEFKELADRNCYYCGNPPSNLGGNKKNNGKYRYNGIDRLNNLLGYFTGNCVPCCKKCNRAKDTYTVQEFYEWIDSINRTRDGR